jgi:GTP cyclohydrolase I
MDKEKIEAAVREILIAVEEDPEREGLLATPKRVANMYEEVFGGLKQKYTDVVKTFESNSDGIVILKGIGFSSMCEHHLLPFIGKATIASIPTEGKVLGLSKVARILDVYAQRPTTNPGKVRKRGG